MNLVNQFSYPLFGLGLLIAALVVLNRVFRAKWIITLLVQLGLIGILVSGFVLLRPGQNTVNNVDEVFAMMGNGRPTFLQFFSNYCTVCMSLTPMVDDLVEDIEADFNILQIDIHSATGRELRERLGFSFSPEFVLYDANGVEVWREHVPPTDSNLERARRTGTDAP